MTDYSRLPIVFPARHDYGPRGSAPTLAVVSHMAEGTRVAPYLVTETRAGVSCHYTIEQAASGTFRGQPYRFADGEIVRILPEDRISGSLSPDRIRITDDPTGYYGASHARGALGAWWGNPNMVVISVEVAGFARSGPTEAQVASMVALHADIERRHAGRVVPLAHRDFADYKACPGRTARVKRAFALMGGHGLSYGETQEVRYMSTRGYRPGLMVDVRAGSACFDYPGGPRLGSTVAGPRDVLGWSPGGRDYALVSSDLGPGRTVWVRAGRVGEPYPAPPATVDCEPVRAAAREAALVEARDTVDALRVT